MYIKTSENYFLVTNVAKVFQDGQVWRSTLKSLIKDSHSNVLNVLKHLDILVICKGTFVQYILVSKNYCLVTNVTKVIQANRCWGDTYKWLTMDWNINVLIALKHSWKSIFWENTFALYTKASKNRFHVIIVTMCFCLEVVCALFMSQFFPVDLHTYKAYGMYWL